MRLQEFFNSLLMLRVDRDERVSVIIGADQSRRVADDIPAKFGTNFKALLGLEEGPYPRDVVGVGLDAEDLEGAIEAHLRNDTLDGMRIETADETFADCRGQGNWIVGARAWPELFEIVLTQRKFFQV